MSGAVSRDFEQKKKRLTKYHPATPSRVFPVAIPIDVRTDPAVVRFAKNAPKKAPGHARRPKIRKAAKVIPVGAHRGVALGLTKANRSPSLAVPKRSEERRVGKECR